MDKVYKTPKQFESAVKRYFNRITVRVQLKDEHGQALKNIKGKPVTVERFAVPPDLGALALSMGLTERTWRNYAHAEGYEDYHPICEWAKQKVKAYLMEQLNTRERTQGVQFNLANNFGMTGKMEIETGPKTRTYEAMSLSERRALIEQTMKDLEEDMEDE